MGKNNAKHVSPERVAQLIQMGCGYTGYIDFPKGQKVYVEIEPCNGIKIFQDYSPKDTSITVMETYPHCPSMIKHIYTYNSSKKDFVLDVLQPVNNEVGYVAKAVGKLSNATGTIGFKSGGSCPVKYYQNGWHGGSRGNIKVFKVSKVGKIGGAVETGTFYFGIGIDLYSAYTKQESWVKFGANTFFSAVGAFGGVPGAIIAAVYFMMSCTGGQIENDNKNSDTLPVDKTRVVRNTDYERSKPIEFKIPRRDYPVFKQGEKP